MSSPGTNAGGWRAAPHATPLRAWREAELARIAARLESGLAEWASDWGSASPVVVRCDAAPGSALRAAPWRLLGRSDAGHAWIEGFDACITACLGELHAATPVAQALGERCAQDALARLAAKLGLDGSTETIEVPAALWSSWSGAVLVTISRDAHVLLSPALLRHMLGAQDRTHRRSALAATAEAVSGQALRLQVELDGCELTLGELGTLQLGDVLRLRHATDAPATVRANGGHVLCAGWLARSRNRRAVELAASRAIETQAGAAP